ncbi:MAG TPA: RNA-binding protein [Methanospirillum sp.]|jgi:PUA domain protein|uniref:RNA-binding protein n=1 Tax=Methanospirillum sp. TaxID=45200 RepID=UPI001BD42DD9|nr:RNA-binding protein [Methanospirillum sp.]HPY59614.1 RNA-binding protein [Methanospirillum sp.]HQC00302.1 RNA-binding protein [Methanospirillum sp.]
MGKLISKRRHSIRKSQVSGILERLMEEIGEGAEHFRGKMIEVIETNQDVQLYLVDKEPLILEKDGVLFPSLRGAVNCPFPQKRIVVDMGAVPYVVNGADIMRPGVVDVTPDVVAGKPVQIVDERHGKPLALGIALFDAADLLAQEKGKVARTWHHVGDDIWNLEF